jgi:hypothetical protein
MENHASKALEPFCSIHQELIKIKFLICQTLDIIQALIPLGIWRDGCRNRCRFHSLGTRTRIGDQLVHTCRTRTDVMIVTRTVAWNHGRKGRICTSDLHCWMILMVTLLSFTREGFHLCVRWGCDRMFLNDPDPVLDGEYFTLSRHN